MKHGIKAQQKKYICSNLYFILKDLNKNEQTQLRLAKKVTIPLLLSHAQVYKESQAPDLVPNITIAAEREILSLKVFFFLKPLLCVLGGFKKIPKLFEIY